MSTTIHHQHDHSGVVVHTDIGPNTYVVPWFGGTYSKTLPLELNGRCTEEEYISYVGQFERIRHDIKWSWKPTLIGSGVGLPAVAIFGLAGFILVAMTGSVSTLGELLYHRYEFDVAMAQTVERLAAETRAKGFQFRYHFNIGLYVKYI